MALSILAGIAYPFLVYWVLGHGEPWVGVLLSLVAMGALCVSLPGRRTRVAGVVAVFIVAGVAMALAAAPFLPFLPPLCVNLGLGWLFGHTLLPDQVPLITRFARLEREPSDEVMSYTRNLTWVWTVFFLLMAAVSATLASMAAHEAWVWFTAVGNYLCVAALFAVEYGYRRWRLPRGEHISPLRQMAMLRAALQRRDW